MFNHEKQHLYPWVEKFRPHTLDLYVGNIDLKVKLAQFITEQRCPHLLLQGRAGPGQTTAAKILMRNIVCEPMIINASEDNNVETVRVKIINFVSSICLNNMKIVLLDEFDGFTAQGQNALRGVMEDYSDVAFILTANNVSKVIEPIRSRTQTFEVIPPSPMEVAKHVATILKLEDVKFDLPALKTIIDVYYPDIRKILGECQSRTVNKVLVADTRQITENDIRFKIIEILSNGESSYSRMMILRQLLANARVRDFSSIYHTLYDKVTEYGSKDISGVIAALAKGQFQDVQVVDREINMMNTFIDILQVI